MGPEEGGGLRPIEPVSETQKRKQIMCFFPKHRVAVVGGWVGTHLQGSEGFGGFGHWGDQIPLFSQDCTALAWNNLKPGL